MAQYRVMRTLLVGLLLATLTACSQDESDTLVFVFQKQKDPAQIRTSAELVASYLSEVLHQKVQIFVPTSYAASVQAIVSKKADIAYVSAIPFLLAKRDAGAELLLAEQRVDSRGMARTDYESVFVVAKDSELHAMEDLVAKASELRMAFTSRTSTSGYVMANWRLVQEGLLVPGQDPREVFASVVFGGNYTLALQEVLEGRADVCAVSYYTVEGPAAGRYLKSEQLDRLRILARTPGVPTHLVCVRRDLEDDLKWQIREALLSLSRERPILLEDVYGAKKLVEVDPEHHVLKAAQAAQYLGGFGVSLDQLVGQPPGKKGNS